MSEEEVDAMDIDAPPPSSQKRSREDEAFNNPGRRVIARLEGDNTGPGAQRSATSGDVNETLSARFERLVQSTGADGRLNISNIVIQGKKLSSILSHLLRLFVDHDVMVAIPRDTMDHLIPQVVNRIAEFASTNSRIRLPTPLSDGMKQVFGLLKKLADRLQTHHTTNPDEKWALTWHRALFSLVESDDSVAKELKIPLYVSTISFLVMALSGILLWDAESDKQLHPTNRFAYFKRLDTLALNTGFPRGLDSLVRYWGVTNDKTNPYTIWPISFFAHPRCWFLLYPFDFEGSQVHFWLLSSLLNQSGNDYLVNILNEPFGQDETLASRNRSSGYSSIDGDLLHALFEGVAMAKMGMHNLVSNYQGPTNRHLLLCKLFNIWELSSESVSVTSHDQLQSMPFLDPTKNDSHPFYTNDKDRGEINGIRTQKLADYLILRNQDLQARAKVANVELFLGLRDYPNIIFEPIVRQFQRDAPVFPPQRMRFLTSQVSWLRDLNDILDNKKKKKKPTKSQAQEDSQDESSSMDQQGVKPLTPDASEEGLLIPGVSLVNIKKQKAKFQSILLDHYLEPGLTTTLLNEALPILHKELQKSKENPSDWHGLFRRAFAINVARLFYQQRMFEHEPANAKLVGLVLDSMEWNAVDSMRDRLMERVSELISISWTQLSEGFHHSFAPLNEVLNRRDDVFLSIKSRLHLFADSSGTALLPKLIPNPKLYYSNSSSDPRFNLENNVLRTQLGMSPGVGNTLFLTLVIKDLLNLVDINLHTSIERALGQLPYVQEAVGNDEEHNRRIQDLKRSIQYETEVSFFSQTYGEQVYLYPCIMFYPTYAHAVDGKRFRLWLSLDNNQPPVPVQFQFNNPPLANDGPNHQDHQNLQYLIASQLVDSAVGTYPFIPPDTKGISSPNIQHERRTHTAIQLTNFYFRSLLHADVYSLLRATQPATMPNIFQHHIWFRRELDPTSTKSNSDIFYGIRAPKLCLPYTPVSYPIDNMNLLDYMDHHIYGTESTRYGKSSAALVKLTNTLKDRLWVISQFNTHTGILHVKTNLREPVITLFFTGEPRKPTDFINPSLGESPYQFTEIERKAITELAAEDALTPESLAKVVGTSDWQTSQLNSGWVYYTSGIKKQFKHDRYPDKENRHIFVECTDESFGKIHRMIRDLKHLVQQSCMTDVPIPQTALITKSFFTKLAPNFFDILVGSTRKGGNTQSEGQSEDKAKGKPKTTGKGNPKTTGKGKGKDKDKGEGDGEDKGKDKGKGGRALPKTVFTMHEDEVLKTGLPRMLVAGQTFKHLIDFQFESNFIANFWNLYVMRDILKPPPISGFGDFPKDEYAAKRLQTVHSSLVDRRLVSLQSIAEDLRQVFDPSSPTEDHPFAIGKLFDMSELILATQEIIRELKVWTEESQTSTGFNILHAFSFDWRSERSFRLDHITYLETFLAKVEKIQTAVRQFNPTERANERSLQNLLHLLLDAKLYAVESVAASDILQPLLMHLQNKIGAAADLIAHQNYLNYTLAYQTVFSGLPFHAHWHGKQQVTPNDTLESIYAKSTDFYLRDTLQFLFEVTATAPASFSNDPSEPIPDSAEVKDPAMDIWMNKYHPHRFVDEFSSIYRTLTSRFTVKKDAPVADKNHKDPSEEEDKKYYETYKKLVTAPSFKNILPEITGSTSSTSTANVANNLDNPRSFLRFDAVYLILSTLASSIRDWISIWGKPFAKQPRFAAAVLTTAQTFTDWQERMWFDASSREELTTKITDQILNEKKKKQSFINLVKTNFAVTQFHINADPDSANQPKGSPKLSFLDTFLERSSVDKAVSRDTLMMPFTLGPTLTFKADRTSNYTTVSTSLLNDNNGLLQHYVEWYKMCLKHNDPMPDTSPIQSPELYVWNHQTNTSTPIGSNTRMELQDNRFLDFLKRSKNSNENAFQLKKPSEGLFGVTGFDTTPTTNKVILDMLDVAITNKSVILPKSNEWIEYFAGNSIRGPTKTVNMRGATSSVDQNSISQIFHISDYRPKTREVLQSVSNFLTIDEQKKTLEMFHDKLIQKQKNLEIQKEEKTQEFNLFMLTRDAAGEDIIDPMEAQTTFDRELQVIEDSLKMVAGYLERVNEELNYIRPVHMGLVKHFESMESSHFNTLDRSKLVRDERLGDLNSSQHNLSFAEPYLQFSRGAPFHVIKALNTANWKDTLATAIKDQPTSKTVSSEYQNTNNLQPTLTGHNGVSQLLQMYVYMSMMQNELVKYRDWLVDSVFPTDSNSNSFEHLVNVTPGLKPHHMLQLKAHQRKLLTEALSNDLITQFKKALDTFRSSIATCISITSNDKDATPKVIPRYHQSSYSSTFDESESHVTFAKWLSKVTGVKTDAHMADADLNLYHKHYAETVKNDTMERVNALIEECKNFLIPTVWANNAPPDPEELPNIRYAEQPQYLNQAETEIFNNPSQPNPNEDPIASENVDEWFNIARNNNNFHQAEESPHSPIEEWENMATNPDFLNDDFENGNDNDFDFDNFFTDDPPADQVVEKAKDKGKGKEKERPKTTEMDYEDEEEIELPDDSSITNVPPLPTTSQRDDEDEGNGEDAVELPDDSGVTDVPPTPKS